MNIYTLKDINVVMTLGDSITAGFGIQGAKGGLNEVAISISII